MRKPALTPTNIHRLSKTMMEFLLDCYHRETNNLPPVTMGQSLSAKGLIKKGYVHVQDYKKGEKIMSAFYLTPQGMERVETELRQS